MECSSTRTFPKSSDWSGAAQHEAGPGQAGRRPGHQSEQPPPGAAHTTYSPPTIFSFKFCLYAVWSPTFASPLFVTSKPPFPSPSFSVSIILPSTISASNNFYPPFAPTSPSIIRPSTVCSGQVNNFALRAHFSNIPYLRKVLEFFS